MNLRVLIAPDKFKGTLNSPQVAESIARGVRRGRPDWKVTLLPIADGGEGTTEALLAGSPHCERISVSTFDPFLRSIAADLALVATTAIFDCASAVGLSLLAPGERDPWRGSTRGLGVLVKACVHRGARRILVGLGGSATNDAGLGLASELGWKFLDSAGGEVQPIPVNFHVIREIVPPTERLDVEVIGLCDVTNPLLGAEGASEVYGRQKGLQNPALMDARLAHVAELVTATIGRDHRNTPGAGAAGGLGFGLLAFCDAKLTSGFNYLSEVMNYDRIVQEHDVVITGEGKIDRQTLFGKGPAELARIARRHKRPVVAFCGIAERNLADRSPFDKIVPMVNDRVCLQEALGSTARVLEEAAYQYACEFGDRHGASQV